jgi:hypothetical protein
MTLPRGGEDWGEGEDGGEGGGGGDDGGGGGGGRKFMSRSGHTDPLTIDRYIMSLMLYSFAGTTKTVTGVAGTVMTTLFVLRRDNRRNINTKLRN